LAIAVILFLASISTQALATWTDWYLTKSVLAKDAQSYIAETDVKKATNVFSANDMKVVWIGKFTNPNAPLGRFSLPMNLYAEFIAPNGKCFYKKRFTTNFLDKTTAHVGMYIATTDAKNMTGTWKVVIMDWGSKEVIDEKSFRLVR
jgi:hypothetical protein